MRLLFLERSGAGRGSLSEVRGALPGCSVASEPEGSRETRERSEAEWVRPEGLRPAAPLLLAPALLALARRFPALTRRRDAKPRFAAMLGLAAILLAACAPSASQPPTAAQPAAIQIELKDFAFKPANITLKAGQRVTLKLVNSDVVEHELLAGRQANATDGGYREDLFKDVQLEIKGGKASSHGLPGNGVLVEAGKTAEVSFTVPDKKGTYEIGCFVPGHYVAGMKGTLVVQ